MLFAQVADPVFPIPSPVVVDPMVQYIALATAAVVTVGYALQIYLQISARIAAEKKAKDDRIAAEAAVAAALKAEEDRKAEAKKAEDDRKATARRVEEVARALEVTTREAAAESAKNAVNIAVLVDTVGEVKTTGDKTLAHANSARTTMLGVIATLRRDKANVSHKLEDVKAAELAERDHEESEAAQDALNAKASR